MATSTNTLTLAHSTVSRRRLLTVGGGIVLVAAVVSGVAIGATLADTKTDASPGDRARVVQGELAQHVLRESGALVALRPASPDASWAVRQHLLRENGAVSAEGSSSMYQHVLRENASGPAS